VDIDDCESVKTEREQSFELTRSHSRSVLVPLTELFSEPFLKDLNLIWQMDISLCSFHGDSIYGEIPNCQMLE
jgi:hypothetical protein